MRTFCRRFGAFLAGACFLGLARAGVLGFDHAVEPGGKRMHQIGKWTVIRLVFSVSILSSFDKVHSQCSSPSHGAILRAYVPVAARGTGNTR